MLNKLKLPHYFVLIMFCFLLRETLTATTMLFVFIGLLFNFLNYPVGRLARNIIGLLLFFSYWIKYGRIIDPEIGLNFLTSIIVLKILESETERDQFMIFFGLILLVSSGSLFERSITYLVFYTLSFYFLLKNFYKNQNLEWSLKDFSITFFWILPISATLFFFVPRLMNTIPFSQSTLIQGEIGYTPDVIVSEIDKLQPNESPVFQVKLSKNRFEKRLYWRGNVLSFNDGWNWRNIHRNSNGVPGQREREILENTIRQDFRLFTKLEYYFFLDYPEGIEIDEDTFFIPDNNKTLAQNKWEWSQTYAAFSREDKPLYDLSPGKNHLMVPLEKKYKEFYRNLISGNDFEEVLNSIKNFYLGQNFSYSISPGISRSMDEFFSKKVGLCSHFASSTAILLRLKGFPARLVSGFLGGEYNHYANYYIVRQNDAHVWVEAYANNRWIRIDPSTWIVPSRSELNGTDFLQGLKSQRSSLGLLYPKILKDLRLWVGQWDYRFYQWLEDIDYKKQDRWFNKLKLKRKWIAYIVPIVVLSFSLLYLFIQIYFVKSNNEHAENQLWLLFQKRLKKRGLTISFQNLKVNEELVIKENNPELIKVWEELVAISFAGKTYDFKLIKKKILNI